MPEELTNTLATSDEGLAFKQYLATLRRTLQNPTDEERAELEAMGAEIHQKTLTPGAVSSTPVLQNLVVQYRNDAYIGLNIMPRVLSTELGAGPDDLAVEYWAEKKASTFEPPPDDAIGTSGTVNDVGQEFETTSTTLSRRSLKQTIDQWTNGAMDAPVRRMVNPTLLVADKLALKQEIRIKDIATTYTNFGTNYTALTGSDRWNSSTGGDPQAVVQTAKAALYLGTPGRTIGATSLEVYNVLRRNPVILESFKYTRGAILTRQQLAEYLELDELYVSSARYKNVKEGQTATYARIWPNSFGVYHVAQSYGQGTVCFGMTIESPRFQSQWFVPGTGGRGAMITQAAFADKSAIIAADAGYLITTPIG